jgi:hypothetical protein
VFVFNFAGREDQSAGIILKKRFPGFPPYRMERVTGAENMDTFCQAG